MKQKIALIFFLGLVPMYAYGQEPYGIEQLLSFERLPFFKPGVRVHYSGSIDRAGRNSDWDWYMYVDENNEYVLMETHGPGCIYNILTYYNCLNQIKGEGKFKFYFDGAEQAQFVLPVDSIGYQYPFIPPLAHDWNYASSGACRIRRSFVPMPFEKSCKVTFTEKLGRFNGGFGHIVYHSYTDKPEGLTTFTGAEDYGKVIEVWNNLGRDPKAWPDNTKSNGTINSLSPGDKYTIFQQNSPGTIASIKMRPMFADPDFLQNVWIKIYWDDIEQPAVNVPLGVFFGNEIREIGIKMLSHGMSQSDYYYNYFPMPFWDSARIQIENKTNNIIYSLDYEIETKNDNNLKYPKEECGYFWGQYKSKTKSQLHQSTHIGSIEGSGHMVLGHVTAYSCNDNNEEEGDVQIYIDGSKTPQIESDGSESWPPYGYGFPVGPQCHPTSAYDGKIIPWSMAKLNLGDYYPFRSRIDFYIEHGGNNINEMEHSGAIFCYLQLQPSMIQTDEIDIGSSHSEKEHNYVIEGSCLYGEPLPPGEKNTVLIDSYYEADYFGMRKIGREFNKYSEFEVKILKDNRGVKLRRRCDQSVGQQRAKVYVDGELVTERDWYYADYNKSKNFLDDEFEIPSKYTKGKDKIKLRIEFVSSENGTWNEYHYWIFSYVD